MLTETIYLPKDVEPANRFIVSLKSQMLKQVKAVNELETRMNNIESRLSELENKR